MDRRIDGLVAIGFAAFGVVLLVAALTFPPVRLVRDSIGPMGLPIALGLIFLVGGGLQAHRSLWLNRKLGPMVAPDGAEDEPEYPVSSRRGVSFVVGGLAYVGLLNPLGYLVATPLFIALGLWALEYRSPWRIAVIGLSFTVVVFVTFSTVLSVPVPTGILTDLLVELNILRPVR